MAPMLWLLVAVVLCEGCRMWKWDLECEVGGVMPHVLDYSEIERNLHN